MPYNRFYIHATLKEKQEILLQGEELHHLKVCRIRIGESVEIINGKNVLAQGRLTALHPQHATLSIQRVETKPPPAQVILAQGLAHMNHLEWIIEKGTELGVTSFWLFPGKLSDKDTLSENQKTRLHHLMLSAVKQCGRLDLPELEFKPPLKEWAPLEGTLIFGDPAPTAPFLWKALLPTLKLPVILFIGPEAGLDKSEVAFFEDTLHARGVRLHPHILRTETASLVGLALIQSVLSS